MSVPAVGRVGREPSLAMLVGTGLLAAAILMLQVVLIRIFSVTMWYHFAFMSISLALFGAAVGGLLVYWWPRRFSIEPGKAERHAALAASLFAMLTVTSVAIHLALPFAVGSTWLHTLWLVILYVDLALPFLLGGLGMTLLLSTYPERIGKVYFADLLGAGLGCLIAIPALATFGGPGAIFAVALLGALAAVALAVAGGANLRVRVESAVLAAVLAVLLVLNPALGILRVQFAKGVPQDRLAFEGWNSFSRISVTGDGAPRPGALPVTWALSTTFRGQDPGSRFLTIDGDAGTPIAKFDGRDTSSLEFLKYDLTAIAYRVQSLGRGPVMIIGPGGGRDVLTARLFGHDSITAVEINPLIVETVNGTFADFSGKPYSLPGVRPVVSDARAYLAHAPASERYGVIQATLIDTWASSSTGAFVLSENFLYTREAFAGYFAHLTDDGMLTMSRWYFKDQPAEAVRLMVLAQAGWVDAGVADPDQHLALVAVERPDSPAGLATLIAKRTPFTTAEVATLKAEVEALGFRLLYAPGHVEASTDVGQLMSRRGAERQRYIDRHLLNVTAPRDDTPFFFNLLRAGDFLLGDTAIGAEGAFKIMPPSLQAVRTLVTLLAIVAVLCALTILVPFAIDLRRRGLGQRLLQGGGWLFLTYIGCLGVGFMMLEVVLMQHFILFLGQPVYALAAILFSLLVFSGCGAGLSQRWAGEDLIRRQRLVLSGVVVATLAYALLLPVVLRSLLGLPEAGRVIISVVLLAPLGLLLGMPFPLGVRLAAQRGQTPLLPWAWAINGAASVLASVGAMTLALAFGFTWVVTVAGLAYLLALGAAAIMGGRSRPAAPVAGATGES